MIGGYPTVAVVAVGLGFVPSILVNLRRNIHHTEILVDDLAIESLEAHPLIASPSVSNVDWLPKSGYHVYI